MIKSYKTEIDPTDAQRILINQTIGTCRFLYNFYLAYRIEAYKAGEKITYPAAFYKYINEVYIPENPDKAWILNTSSKARRNALDNLNTAFVRFFEKKADFPVFKKKRFQNSSFYFVRNNDRSFIKCDRHRLWVPTLGWVRLKEKGYFPTTEYLKVNNAYISSGTIKRKADRYYVSIRVKISDSSHVAAPVNDGIGADLGIKETVILSDGTMYSNINKTPKMKKIKKKIKRVNRSLSRKLKKKKKGVSGANIDKNTLELQKLYKQEADIRLDYYNKIADGMTKTKPSYIVLEDLNIKGMMKNRHLSAAIQEQALYLLKTKITNKAKARGIEIRIVSRWYPSSKTCSSCGYINKDLKLKDRTYICPECGMIMDRDINAALNLKNCAEYKIS